MATDAQFPRRCHGDDRGVCRPHDGRGRDDGLRGLQSALDNPANTVVTLNEGAHCPGHFDLPSRAITFEGAGTGATLDGQQESQILSGSGVGNTTIRNLTFSDGQGLNEDGGAIRLHETTAAPARRSKATRSSPTAPARAAAAAPWPSWASPRTT